MLACSLAISPASIVGPAPAISAEAGRRARTPYSVENPPAVAGRRGAERQLTVGTTCAAACCCWPAAAASASTCAIVCDDRCHSRSDGIGAHTSPMAIGADESHACLVAGRGGWRNFGDVTFTDRCGTKAGLPLRGLY